MTRKLPAFAGPLLLVPALSTIGWAQAADSARVTFAGYVDAYYAYDFGRPATLDRSFASTAPFTTQPARHNEFNVNLAFLEAKLEGPRIRGRIALQTGTSVQSNYSPEPTRGTISGPLASRHLQEAFAGYRLAQRVWIDAGIFFSHVGMEGWISRDNPTYTRSLVADYSPYYSSGARATWQATPALTVRVDLVNGWQNISETNSAKGVGARLDYELREGSTISAYTFAGNEVSSTRRRMLHGVGTNFGLGDRLRFLGEFDLGSQEREGGGGRGQSTWYGITAILRTQVTPRVALAGRLERFDDPDGVVIAPGAGLPAFKASGGSLGVDVRPESRLLWRTEVRAVRNDGAVFPSGRGSTGATNAVVVTSLALTI